MTLFEHLNNYASAVLVATIAVSSILRFAGLADKPWAQRVCALCFDVGGAIRGYQARKATDPEAK